MRLIIVLALFVNAVFSWSTTSHKIVARVASRLLTGAAKRFVVEHLPKREGTRLSHAESALVLHASWADQIAESPAYAWSRDLHFVNTPFRDCRAFEEARDCGAGSGRCIVTAIANYTERAIDITLPLEQRAEALKFLIHFVADVHSGMHVAFSEDRGGNRIHLTTPEISLHEVWDSRLLEEALSGGSWVQLSSELINELSYHGDLRISVRDGLRFAAEIASETANEITCQFAYKDASSWIPVHGHILSEDYLISRSELALLQLSKAGVRLAELLDNVAISYYQRKRMAEPAAAGLPTFNAFEPLYLLETDDSVISGDSDPEDQEIEPVVTGAVPPARRRVERPKRLPVRTFVDGVNIAGLVAIRVEQTIIRISTSRERAESDVCWRLVAFEFASIPDSAIMLTLDCDVFRGLLTKRLMGEVLTIAGLGHDVTGMQEYVSGDDRFEQFMAKNGGDAPSSSMTTAGAPASDPAGTLSSLLERAQDLLIRKQGELVFITSLRKLVESNPALPQVRRFNFQWAGRWRVLLDVDLRDGVLDEEGVDALLKLAATPAGRRTNLEGFKHRGALLSAIPVLDRYLNEVPSMYLAAQLSCFGRRVRFTKRDSVITVSFALRPAQEAFALVDAYQSQFH